MQHLRIFISSPGDVAEEREAARKAIRELQREPAHAHVRLEAVSYDDPDAPTAMPAQLDPQEAVNRGLPKPSVCDVVVGVFWSRLGTPLDPERYDRPYRSGTEWELCDAFAAQPGPDIFLYRRTEKPKIDLDDPELDDKKAQYAAVKAFLGELCAQKRFVTDVEGPNTFKERLKNDLRQCFSQCIAGRAAGEHVGLPAEQAADAPKPRDGTPFRGFDRFTLADAPYFCGRESDIDRLTRTLRRNDWRFLALIGPSGCGKSSLLEAGLLAQLEAGALGTATPWRFVFMTPAKRGDPFRTLRQELTRLSGKHDLAGAEIDRVLDGDGPLGTADLGPFAAGVRLCLIVDQLEELLSPSIGDASRLAFARLLTEASSSGLHVFATLRDDFLLPLMELGDDSERPLQNLLQDQVFHVAPLTRSEIRQAIERPPRLAGAEDPAALADAILADIRKVGGDERGALPLVAFCLQELWPPHGAPRLTVQAYKEIGRLAGAVSRCAERAMTGFTNGERKALPTLFGGLVHVHADGTATRKYSQKADPAADPVLARIEEALLRSRLLRVETPEAPVVEIAHETLFGAWEELHDWIDANRDKLRMAERIRQRKLEWQDNANDPVLLLPTGRPLEEGRQLLSDAGEVPIGDLRDYVQASLDAAAERTRQAKAKRQAELDKEKRLRTAAEAAAAKALMQESRALAALANQATASGDAVTGMLLALRGLALPNGPAHRPHNTEAATAAADGLWAKRERRVLNGHESPVTEVAFSPDGGTILTGSLDNAARLWDAQTGDQRRVLNGHEGFVSVVAFSPDGQTILTGSSDDTARLWDANTGDQRRVLNGHEGFVSAVAFSPDGRTILTGSWDGTARLWDAKTGDQRRVLNGHENWVSAVAFSPDGQTILTGSSDNTARLWDAHTGDQLLSLNGHEGSVSAVAFSPDGQTILTGSSDNTARLWDAHTGDQLLSLNGHEGSVSAVAFSPDGQTILTGSSDNTARLWDAQTGDQRSVLNGHRDNVNAVAFSPDGKTILTGSDDNTARLWDAQTGDQILSLNGHEFYVTAVAFSPDGKPSSQAPKTTPQGSGTPKPGTKSSPSTATNSTSPPSPSAPTEKPSSQAPKTTPSGSGPSDRTSPRSSATPAPSCRAI